MEASDERRRGAFSDQRWRRVIRKEGELSQIHGPLRHVTRSESSAKPGQELAWCWRSSETASGLCQAEHSLACLGLKPLDRQRGRRVGTRHHESLCCG